MNEPGVPPPDVQVNRAHLDFIDALRGLAVLGVIAVHVALSVKGLANPMWGVMVGAQTGVQLFFIASAFTLMYSARSRKGVDDSYGRFMTRRFFRIAPLFYVGIILYTALRWFVSGQPTSPVAIFLTATFTHALSIPYHNAVVPGGWTIGTEFAFYALFPLLASRIKSTRGALALVIASLVLSVGGKLLTARAFPGNYAVDIFVDHSLSTQLVVFALGILAYQLVVAEKDSAIWKVLGRPYSEIPVIGLLVALGAVYMRVPMMVVAFSFLLFLLTLTVSRGRHPLLVNPLTRFLGMISFSMYIWHFAVLNGLEALTANLPREPRSPGRRALRADHRTHRSRRVLLVQPHRKARASPRKTALRPKNRLAIERTEADRQSGPH